MNAGASGSAPYVVDEGVVIPTDWASGPWFGTQQHGACLLGLLAHFLEQVPTHAPMRFTRITADLSRPVPMEPMAVEARALRDGRRVQSLEATISVAGEIVSRALATRIRFEPGLVPGGIIPEGPAGDAAPPLASVETSYRMSVPSFQDRVEARDLDNSAPTEWRTWHRLRGSLVEGEVASPTVRLASIADMVRSSSNVLGPDWISINPEVTLQIEREPLGEWICVVSTVRLTDDGIGMSEGVLYDESGRVGSSAKATLNYRRED